MSRFVIRAAIVDPVGTVHRVDSQRQTLCGTRGVRVVPVRSTQALVYKLYGCQRCWSDAGFRAFAGMP